ncbi:hypothetical protein LptCag_1443 [Leptospirillum ferriphilum]|uniref:Uncharacterized protein n=1 Tax=Leptospirillum ferriphilum TaxID=178606 RepID=A0A094W892_9BACT|nr:hypothetical protein LptCag_1443 [Leptospirillum ferriphilum]
MKNFGKNDTIVRIKTLPFLNGFPGHHDEAGDRLSLPLRMASLLLWQTSLMGGRETGRLAFGQC